MISERLENMSSNLPSNIHLIYNLTIHQILYLHPSISWINKDSQDVSGNAILQLIDPQDLAYLREVFEDVKKGSFIGKTNMKLNGPKGHRWLQVFPITFSENDQTIIFCSVLDVTNEVNDLQSLTKFADKKNSILYMLAHDLRGPLNIARSILKITNRAVYDPQVLKQTSHIATIIEESLEMIGNLVKREFLETVETELTKKRVDIAQKLNEYLEECKRSQDIAKIEFEFKSVPEDIWILVDVAKFMQVVNNLISNSLKFTPAGGKITVDIRELDDHIQFLFSDTGIGIPEEMLPRIFEQFTPARRVGLQGEPTHGLGLSIVKTIVAWHGGSISCQSEEGKGTSFLVKMPKIPGGRNLGF